MSKKPNEIAYDAVTAVFNQPELVLTAKLSDHIHVERITQGMGDHDCLRLAGERLLQMVGIDVQATVDIQKHRDAAILDDGVDGRRKPTSDGYDLIPPLDSPIPQLRACKAREGQ